MTANDIETIVAALGTTTYAEMFIEYVRNSTWITPDEMPLVFHASKLAAQLDAAMGADDETKAAKDSAFLQAVERLHRRRPKPESAPTSTEIPGQSNLFEFLT